MNNNEKEQKQKKKRKWYVRLALFIVKSILILAILGMLIYGVIAGITTYQQYKKNKEFNEEVLFDSLQSKEVIDELFKNSDETLYDRPMSEIIDLGIDPMSFDTSQNGLPDEEALKHGADPSKFSTADDGISDMVKILEGYEPTEKMTSSEEMTLNFDDFGVALVTEDVNDKYFSFIEAYTMPKIVNSFHSIIEPFQVKDYEGHVEVTVPANKMDKTVTAYQFNFDTLEMEKIKKQKVKDNIISFDLQNAYPVFLLNKEGQGAMNDFGTHYFFRLSVPLFENVLGFNHKVFVFKKTLFPSFMSREEVIEDDEFGIADYGYQTMSIVVSFLIDKAYHAMDFIFEHELNKGSIFEKGGLIDYGTIEGTEQDAKKRAMPWTDEYLRAQYETENSETEAPEEVEDGNFEKMERGEFVLADSGFHMKQHAFRFANVTTTYTTGGTCAGYARLTEKIYNNETIPLSYSAKFSSGLARLVHLIEEDLPKKISYDITNNEEAYKFLNTKHQYSYTMQDEATKGLTDGDSNTSYTKPLDVSAITEPDRALLEMLQTYYIEANNENLKLKNFVYDTKHANIIDKVIDEISGGNIVYVALTGGPGGHGVNAYRAEQDEYNPDKMYLYIYDNNLPYEKITYMNGSNEEEVRMEIIKQKKKTFFNWNPEFYNYYEFDFAPVNGNSDYRWATENGDKVRFIRNNEAIKK